MSSMSMSKGRGKSRGGFVERYYTISVALGAVVVLPVKPVPHRLCGRHIGQYVHMLEYVPHTMTATIRGDFTSRRLRTGPEIQERRGPRPT